MPLTGEFDSEYWARIVSNIQSGEGLYGLEGYYYTPVWGYFLGAISGLNSFILGVGELGTLIVEALPIQAISDFASSGFVQSFMDRFFPTTATAAELSFSMSIDIMLFLFDLLAAYLVYVMVMDRTESRKLAITAFALVFLCPLIFLTSSVDSMFDTVCVAMTLLSLTLLYKGHTFFSGMMISVAILLKFFPIFIAPLMLAYVISKYRGTEKLPIQIIAAFSGVIIMIVAILLPQIMAGELSECFRFLSDRIDTGDDSFIMMIAGKLRVLMYLAVAASCIAIMYLNIKRRDANPEKALLNGCLLMFVIMMLYPAPPRYLVFVLPFLVYAMVSEDSRLKYGWICLSLAAILFVAAGFTMLLTSMADAGLISINTVIGMFNSMFNGNLGAAPFIVTYLTAAVIQFIGTAYIFWILVGDGVRNFYERAMKKFNVGGM